MTIEELNAFCKDTFIDHLGIELLEYGDDFVVARMPVDRKKIQPMGILHGGASLALAETAASVGSYLLVDPEKYTVRGLQVSGNHVSPVSKGHVYARAEIIHKGSMTHIWDVKIVSDEQKPVSLVRVTMAVVETAKLRK
ncbi:MAG: PaaI family thioesterase [Bacteroidales bacterium]|nr:PaaI family thioesterase [Bacteroidales bacterium]MBN2764705.1 PaaI family thioesterase [Bacteroidales bacterium]